MRPRSIPGSRHIGRHERWGARAAAAAAAVSCVLLLSALSPALVGCGDDLEEAARLEQAGDWQGALLVYQDVLREEPENLKALSGAAVALMVLQRYDEALRFQEQVAAADPSDAQIRVELGFNYLNHQARSADAVDVMREAVALEPTAKNQTFFAQALKQAGDLEAAEFALRKAIEVDERYGYAYTQLVRLLEDEGREAEALEVRREAAAVGVAVDDQP